MNEAGTVKIVIERDDGRTFTFSDESWRITYLSGLDHVEFSSHYDDSAYSEGAMPNGDHVDKRYVEIHAHMSRNFEAERQSASGFFGPEHLYKLTATYMNTTRWIGGFELRDCGKLSDYEVPTGNIHRPIDIVVQMCFNRPYLKSVDEYGKDIAATQAMIAFPYIDTVEYGHIPADISLFADVVDLVNNGDVSTAFRAELTATGTVVNPVINKGDSYVRIIDTMVTGDKYIIDAVSKKIYKNGVNNFKAIDRTSSFEGVQFTPGDNKISYGADDGELNLSVKIFFNQRYRGI